LKARTETELPNSYMPSASLAWTLKPGRDSSIFRPVIPAGAESSASLVIDTVAVSLVGADGDGGFRHAAAGDHHLVHLSPQY
jgi:hypothetical protein